MGGNLKKKKKIKTKQNKKKKKKKKKHNHRQSPISRQGQHKHHIRGFRVFKEKLKVQTYHHSSVDAGTGSPLNNSTTCGPRKWLSTSFHVIIFSKKKKKKKGKQKTPPPSYPLGPPTPFTPSFPPPSSLLFPLPLCISASHS